ncbi:hypothetical protein AYI70_g6514, partial [Smittium culicis]
MVSTGSADGGVFGLIIVGMVGALSIAMSRYSEALELSEVEYWDSIIISEQEEVSE